MSIEKQVAPITTVKWKISNTKNMAGVATIIGEWAEDNSQYEVQVPHQLAESLVAMQNSFCNLTTQLSNAENQVKKLKSQFDLFEEITDEDYEVQE